MRDMITKLAILRGFLASAFDEWRDQVWRRDLDEYYCCSGGLTSWDICGCGGVTVRETFRRPSPQKEGGE
ncbi:hypothetical protein ATO13_22286 [Stappia sp. 22II-S9-Z10]|nr:hypothetical protein ATO13_22286 [Stappia sp. 22II-S9-Z10]